MSFIYISGRSEGKIRLAVANYGM